MARHLLPFLSLCFVFAFSARADWKSDTHTTLKGKATRTIYGALSVQDGKVRLESDTPTNMYFLWTIGAKEAQAVIPSAESYFTAASKNFDGKIPVCLEGDIEACYRKSGLKKLAAEESVAGEKCAVWQGKVRGADTKIWRSPKRPIQPAVKMTVQLDGGAEKGGTTVETLFSAFSAAKIDPKKFKLPPAYRYAGKLEDLIQKMKFFTGGN